MLQGWIFQKPLADTLRIKASNESVSNSSYRILRSCNGCKITVDAQHFHSLQEVFLDSPTFCWKIFSLCLASTSFTGFRKALPRQVIGSPHVVRNVYGCTYKPKHEVRWFNISILSASVTPSCLFEYNVVSNAASSEVRRVSWHNNPVPEVSHAFS